MAATFRFSRVQQALLQILPMTMHRNHLHHYPSSDRMGAVADRLEDVTAHELTALDGLDAPVHVVVGISEDVLGDGAASHNHAAEGVAEGGAATVLDVLVQVRKLGLLIARTHVHSLQDVDDPDVVSGLGIPNVPVDGFQCVQFCGVHIDHGVLECGVLEGYVPLDESSDVPDDVPLDVLVDVPLDVLVDVPLDVLVDVPLNALVDVPLGGLEGVELEAVDDALDALLGDTAVGAQNRSHQLHSIDHNLHKEHAGIAMMDVVSVHQGLAGQTPNRIQADPHYSSHPDHCSLLDLSRTSGHTPGTSTVGLRLVLHTSVEVLLFLPFRDYEHFVRAFYDRLEGVGSAWHCHTCSASQSSHHIGGS